MTKEKGGQFDSLCGTLDGLLSWGYQHSCRSLMPLLPTFQLSPVVKKHWGFVLENPERLLFSQGSSLTSAERKQRILVITLKIKSYLAFYNSVGKQNQTMHQVCGISQRTKLVEPLEAQAPQDMN